MKFDLREGYTLNMMAQFYSISDDQCAVEFTRTRSALGTMEEFNKVVQKVQTLCFGQEEETTQEPEDI